MKNNQELYELLRQKRLEISNQQGLPPYMILQNKVLDEIVEKRPQTFGDLRQIKGMGDKKIEKYGKIILEIVNEGNFINPSPQNTNSETEDKIYTVSQFLDHINSIISPEKIVIQGEIQEIDNRDRYTFFSLRDKEQDAVLGCFTWQSVISNLGIELKEGLEIQVIGFSQIYKPNGKFSFQVERINLVGEGTLKIAIENLKKKLEQQGFFALQRKKQLSQFPKEIGLITSDSGDALHDFLRNLDKFGIKIYLYNVHVEGIHAVGEIAEAISWFNGNMPNIDVLALIRGGGSLESLQSYNSEEIAKAIFSSRIPIITGIGHENDTTIADLVADFRASTPTAAARRLSDSWRNAEIMIKQYTKNLTAIFSEKCKNEKLKIENSEKNLINQLTIAIRQKNQTITYLKNTLFSSSYRLVHKIDPIETSFMKNYYKMQKLIYMTKNDLVNKTIRFNRETVGWQKQLEKRLNENQTRLQLSDPCAKLKQGYSIIFNSSNSVVKSTHNVKIGDLLEAKLSDGDLETKVEKIK